jgi:ankyrin repeat protein
MDAIRCCICLGDYIFPKILNSGTTACGQCMKKITRCPESLVEISAIYDNAFMMQFLHILYYESFSMEKLLSSSNRIAYLRRFNKIENKEIRKLLDLPIEAFSLELEEFKLIIDKCIDVECTNSNGLRIIHLICTTGTIDMFKYLIEKGVNIECIDINGFRPIHYVHYNSNPLGFIKCFVEKRAHLEFPSRNGVKLIHFLCIKNLLESVKFLAAQGIDLNCADCYGLYPIHYVCEEHKLELAKFLVENGADVNCATRIGCKPIHLACDDGALNLVKFLLENGADLNCKDSNGRQPIYNACGSNNVELVKFLVKNGAKVECEDIDEVRPIHIACMYGLVDTVKFLVEECGANLECCDINGEFPIHYACYSISDNLEIIKYLVDKCVDLECENTQGMRPIHTACKYLIGDNMEAFKYLVEVGGVNIDRPAHNRWTPIQFLRHYGRAYAPQLIEYLINMGANTT